MIRCVQDISPELEDQYRGSFPAVRGYAFLGLGLEVRSNCPPLAGLIEDIYRAFAAPAPLPRPLLTYLLQDQGDRETPYRTVDPGFDSFLCSDPSRAVSFWGAQLMCNHLFRIPFLFIHGAVLQRSGRALVFAGVSGAGKTSFILSLGGEGFSFFSDEFAPLALAGGEIHPFPRAFFLDQRTISLFPTLADGQSLPFFYDHQEKKPNESEPPRRYILGPERAFLSLGREPAPPAGFFFLDGFSPVATTGRPLPAGRALERLLELAVNPAYLPPAAAGQAIERLIEILSRVPAVLLRPGPLGEDPGSRARIIEELAAGRPEGVNDLKKIGRRCREILLRRPVKTA